MKTFILGATAGTGGATGGAFVKQDGSGGVIDNNTAGLEIGIAESTKLVGEKVGVIKEGLCKVTAVAAAYNFGDALEVATGGATVQALASGTQVATAAETLDLTGGAGSLWVYFRVP
jgi:hypothetical protein